MKRILSAMLILAMAAGMVACGSTDNGSAVTTAGGQTEQTDQTPRNHNHTEP